MFATSSSSLMLIIVVLIATYVSVECYSFNTVGQRSSRFLQMSTKKNNNQDERVFRVEIPLGEGYQSVITNFRPIFAKSTIFVTTYDIPFSLNVEKAPQGRFFILHGELVSDSYRSLFFCCCSSEIRLKIHFARAYFNPSNKTCRLPRTNC